ncbi:hypothetical protein ASPBRDRAFT_191211 [Aspergillus brasiliensis CBS 101740]|uniref:Uncharacterized protein n=1 Tax=Aspergillus brasiliensis (strain CBS 101740 / IMI 381727 / IBT 21946) TaxID=767769 RepID=A0A1L9V1Y3_ASPBC|nr:hypothetical protein ASPBRDRAFT_191211 [Aspergillus brasiliensis CBS 101740]
MASAVLIDSEQTIGRNILPVIKKAFEVPFTKEEDDAYYAYWKKNKKVLTLDNRQLARYMDDHFTRFGFFTTYEYTWFVKRIDNTHFAMSPPISTAAQSTADKVSLRECLLATALRA